MQLTTAKRLAIERGFKFEYDDAEVRIFYANFLAMWYLPVTIALISQSEWIEELKKLSNRG